MTFSGPPAHVKTIDLPDALEFRVLPLLHGYHLVIVGVIAAITVGSISNVWWGMLAGAALAGGWYFVKRNDQRERVLRITDKQIEAHGRQEWVSLAWNEVIRLEYLAGGEDSPSGLAAKTGPFSWVMLVKDLGHTDAQIIMDAIWKRFPLVENSVEPPTLLDRWRDRDGSISLGLNEHR